MEDEKKIDRIQRREEMLDQIFGKNRKIDNGNIWGWRVSMIGFVLMLGFSAFAIYGTYKGWIRWDDAKEQQNRDQHPFFKNVK
jgi:hypothetical protein